MTCELAPPLLYDALVAVTQFTVRFWGVRGSVATAGPDFHAVGGNTSCVEVRVGDSLIVLDAGTGLPRLGDGLRRPVRATFLFSHFHWDHIQGFPFFRPAYEAGNSFVLYGPGKGARGLEAALRRQMESPHFPVSMEEMKARFDFRSVRAGEELWVGDALVTAGALNHPQGCLGYRISDGRHSVVYATDTERLGTGIVDPAAVQLAQGADLLIYDAQYTDEEYRGQGCPARKGWGHSTASDACRVARVAGVRRLALFHHDPERDDREMAKLLRGARAMFRDVVVAREGTVVDLLAPAARQVRERAWPGDASEARSRPLRAPARRA